MLENWDGKKREMKSGEATKRSTHESFEVYSTQLSLCAIATTCVTMVRLCLLSQTDVPIIIIFITYRPRLPLPKPERADGAVAGKDSSVTFLAHN